MEKCNNGEGFKVNGKCIPYRNDRQKEGYKDAEVSEAKTNSKVINKYIFSFFSCIAKMPTGVSWAWGGLCTPEVAGFMLSMCQASPFFSRVATC